MKAETVYQKLLEKSNKNFTNGTISLDRARAVFLFNEEQNKFIEWCLTKKNNTSIEDIERLVTTKHIHTKDSGSNYESFELPENFFSFINIEVTASDGKCTNIPMMPIQAKPENIHELLFDDNNKPSLKYRETLYTIEDNSIKVYKDNFNVDKVILKYYRTPVQFDLEGYVTEFNSNSVNSDPEFSDRIVDRIISMCTTSFDINNENLDKVQFDMNRVNSKF